MIGDKMTSTQRATAPNQLLNNLSDRARRTAGEDPTLSTNPIWLGSSLCDQRTAECFFSEMYWRVFSFLTVFLTPEHLGHQGFCPKMYYKFDVIFAHQDKIDRFPSE